LVLIITELCIDSFFLVPIIDSSLVGFLSLIIDSPIVFLSSDRYPKLIVR
jgi:hypothetical protein